MPKVAGQSGSKIDGRFSLWHLSEKLGYTENSVGVRLGVIVSEAAQNLPD